LSGTVRAAVVCSASDQASEAGAAFCAATIAAIGIAWLFVILATTHFLLDSGVLNQLPKPLHRILNLLPISQTKFDHQNAPLN
jgi:hypothetical protein